MQSCSEQKLSNGLEPESREALESKIEAASFLRLQLRQQVKQHETEKHALETHFSSQAGYFLLREETITREPDAIKGLLS